MDSSRFQLLFAPLGIRKERVSAVDEHIAFFQQRRNLIDHGVDRRAGFHHHHRYARLFQRRDEFLHRARRLNILSLGASGREFLGDFRGAIEHSDRKSL